MRIISPSLSPNAEAEDVVEAIRVLLHPGLWQQGEAIDEVEAWFTDYLNASCAVSFDSGRSAFLALLRAFDIGPGDEVLLQAFTCVAVPNSVRWAGATPVYVDIDESFNIDPKDLEKKITKYSKAIIIQHTFGIPAQMDAIFSLARKYNLMVIEDCAHSFGATYKGKKLGTLGDASFFSFGRDKVISSVWGGMATMSQKSKVKSQKLREFQEKLPYPSHFWILQQLFHPVVFAAILPTYNSGIGKVILETMKRAHLLSVPVYDEEKLGRKHPLMSRRYPNALAQLLVKQLAKLERYNQSRRRIAFFYHEALKSRSDVTLPRWDKKGVYLRFPILVENPSQIIGRARREGILLGNWYHNLIDPEGVDLQIAGYLPESCVEAERAGGHIVNLPTLITEESARRIIAVL